MQKCFLTTNKETQVASYLQHRSIIEVTEEHRSLSELNLEKLDIVDVDKFLYIYYPTDDGNLSFRSDMNALRTLMNSPFFHTSEILFILVQNEDPLLEDLIHSALRDSPITSDKIEIINHGGALMLADVSKYIAGSASGQSTSSSYRDVYVHEADKEEKERFTNTAGDLDSVLPALTDMAALYKQRSGVEAISAGRMVSEQAVRPSLVSEFTRVSVDSAKIIPSFVVSGERWSKSENAINYLVEYFHIIGNRTLIINLDQHIDVSKVVSECSVLDLMDIKAPVIPDNPSAVINCRFNQLGYVIEYIQNVQGVNNYIFYCDCDDYGVLLDMVSQFSEQSYSVFVAHYSKESVDLFLERGYKVSGLFLYFSRFKADFDLQEYKNSLRKVAQVVAEYPTEDIDYTSFYEFATGGELRE